MLFRSNQGRLELNTAFTGGKERGFAGAIDLFAGYNATLGGKLLLGAQVEGSIPAATYNSSGNEQLSGGFPRVQTHKNIGMISAL